MIETDDNNFVFFDTKGKRWPRLRMYFLLLSAVFFLCLVLFVRSLFIIEKFQLPPSIQQLKERLKVLQKRELLTAKKSSKPIWLEFSRTKPSNNSQAILSPESKAALRASPTLAVPDSQPPFFARSQTLCLGFFENSNAESLASLQAHTNQLTHICPEWFFMEDGNGTLLTKPDPVVQAIARKNNIVLLPLLSNLINNTWQPEAVEGVANGPESRQIRFIENLTTQLVAIGAGGVVIDWGQVDPTYKDAVTTFLVNIAAALHADKMELWLRIPMGRELKLYDLEPLAQAVDHFIATLHDENSDTDPPGPIASLEWFEGWLDTVTAYGTPSQWIVELGSYGYDWPKGGRSAETISFADVMTRAGRAEVSIDRVEMPAYNPGFSYSDADTEHTVWFLDVATFINQLGTANKRDIGGLAIYALGSEDPAIWQVIRREPLAIDEELLHNISTIDSRAVTQVGNGQFLTIEDTRSEGSRQFVVDESGLLTETYDKLPSYLTVCHQGNGKDDEVAISFDDGPDPKWTPQILDVLKAKGITASFFMVGMQMEDHPRLVRRIIEEGHEVGLHTYTHPNLSLISEERIRVELNAAQRLLETISGRSTILFRPPYHADSRPTLPAEVLPLKIIQELGYLTVAEDIDPEDFGAR
jgi:spore germination protein YaaH